MIRRLFIVSSFILCGTTIIAQNESDALMFSQSDVLGTARYTSMGGAFTALGGDATSSLINPAGIGVLRSNEFSLSGTYTEHSSDASYYGNNEAYSNGKINIGSLHIAGVKDMNRMGKWRSVSVSFGVNRVSAFNNSYSVGASNVNSSILDDYTNIINEIGIHSGEIESAYPFDLFLLWENRLLENIPGDFNSYYNTSGTYPVDQRFDVETSGAKRQSYFNVGTNYDDKLYLGVGLNFSNSRFERTSIYSEYFDPADTNTVLDEFSQAYYETVNGSGISATLGAIYRPTNSLRLGLSFKTPEVQRYEFDFSSDNITIVNDTAYEVLSPVVIRDYTFRVVSPFNATLGVAYTFQKFGLVSVEADYVDYSMISMKGITDNDPFTSENNSIENLLQPTINIRSGLEYRITSSISARAGYARYGNPYKPTVISDGSFEVYSGGAGYRADQFYVDLSYQYKKSSEKFYLYDAALVEPVKNNIVDHRITMTFGLKF